MPTYLKIRAFKKTVSAFFFFFIAMHLSAQESKIKVSIYAELAIPTYTEIPAAGFGGGLNAEYLFNPKIAGIVTIGYDHFTGHIIDHFNKDTINGFSLLPVMAGFKYYPRNNYYICGEAGVPVGLQHAGNSFALSPGVGMLLPIKGERKIDIGLRFTGVMRQTSFPENNFLNRGGYSFLTGRIGFIF